MNSADGLNEWLRSHSNIHSYAIVDDYDDGFTQDDILAAHFVQTTYAQGLTPEKAEKIIEILNQ